MVEKNDGDPCLGQLLDEHELMRVVARQPIGRVNVQPIEGACIGYVAKPVQCGSRQRTAAATIIDKYQLLAERQAIRSDALPQARDLTGNGVLLSLLFGRNPRVNGRANQCRGLHD